MSITMNIMLVVLKKLPLVNILPHTIMTVMHGRLYPAPHYYASHA
jgi:hypothetical protein